MRFDCEAAREHIDAWALGALDADERRALDAHLATCAECSRDADISREAAMAFAHAAPLVTPGAGLKSRIIASAAVLTDIGRVRGARWWRAAVAAAIVVGIGAIIWGTVMQLRVNDLQDDRAAIAAGATEQAGDLASVRADLTDASESTSSLQHTIDTQNAVLDVAFQADAVRTSLAGTALAPGARGWCVWSRARELGAFIAENLPPPPEGMVYQMWVVYENRWLSAGSFDVDDEGRGRLIMRSDNDTEGAGAFEGFAVTVEPPRVEGERTGEMVLASAPISR